MIREDGNRYAYLTGSNNCETSHMFLRQFIPSIRMRSNPRQTKSHNLGLCLVFLRISPVCPANNLVTFKPTLISYSCCKQFKQDSEEWNICRIRWLMGSFNYPTVTHRPSKAKLQKCKTSFHSLGRIKRKSKTVIVLECLNNFVVFYESTNTVW